MKTNGYLNMDDSKARVVKPKIALHVWSNPHSNTLIAIEGKKGNIVKHLPDYEQGVNQRQDLTNLPVNLF